MTQTHRVLTLNAGSSSLKAAIYALGPSEERLAAAQVDRIGQADSRLRITDAARRVISERGLAASDHARALQAVLEWVQDDNEALPLTAAAHRVVHGGAFTDPQPADAAVMKALRDLVPVDPDHLPQTLAAIDTISRRYPRLLQILCFDTAFHRSMGSIARLYPLPAPYRQAGLRRYGFHGLSCEYVLAAMRSIDPAAAEGRLIIAHLGSGASMTAVQRGESVDTTMGFSPTGGLMMGTRTGDLDPGVLLYMIRERQLTPADVSRLINRESGLLGVSGTTSDMRDLLAREAVDRDAAAAVDLFCYLARKALGGLLAALGGLDTLIFTGGIGENSPGVRQRIVGGLDGLGLLIDPQKNDAGSRIISSAASTVTIRVIETDEDLVLARHARRFLAGGSPASL